MTRTHTPTLFRVMTSLFENYNTQSFHPYLLSHSSHTMNPIHATDDHQRKSAPKHSTAKKVTMPPPHCECLYLFLLLITQHIHR